MWVKNWGNYQLEAALGSFTTIHSFKNSKITSTLNWQLHSTTSSHIDKSIYQTHLQAILNLHCNMPSNHTISIVIQSAFYYNLHIYKHHSSQRVCQHYKKISNHTLNRCIFRTDLNELIDSECVRKFIPGRWCFIQIISVSSGVSLNEGILYSMASGAEEKWHRL